MVVMLAVGCSTSRKDAPLKAFTEDQQKKVVDKSVSVQAEPLFWAALYEPTRDDLEGLRAAWNEHSRAFPESRAIQEIEKVLAAPGERPLLVALFTSDTDKADLSSKSLGWSVSPVPQQIKELDNADQPLRALFPVKNTWARYYLLKYTSPVWADAVALVLALPQGKVELTRVR